MGSKLKKFLMMSGLLFPAVGLYGADLEHVAATSFPESSSCASRLGYLESHLRNEQLETKELLARLANQNFQAIYIGTSHNAWDTEAVARIMAALHRENEAFDCFTIEEDGRCQEGINSIVSGRKTFEEAAKTAPKLCAYTYATAEEALFKTARDNGIRVFAVDDLSVGFDQTDGLPTQSVATTMPHRNEAMARATAALLRDGTCRKVLGLAGGAHIVKGFYDDNAPALWGSISDRLKLLGVNVAPVNLINRASKNTAAIFAPEDCSWNLWDKIPAGGASFGFLPHSPAPPAFYPLYPYGVPSDLPYDRKNPVNWDEYRAVIVIP